VSGVWFDARVSRPRSTQRTLVSRRTRNVLANVTSDLERLRNDAGISRSRLAEAAGIDPGYLTRVFAGERKPTVAVLVALCRALGADLSIRAFPTTGPNIHDKSQAAIVEELLRIVHPTWLRSVEVAVVRPSRGFIDLVLQRIPDVVATEVQTRIDRLEQQIRWSRDKAASLPSSDLWQRILGDRSICRLLVLRNTPANREMARRFEATLRAAYPARAADVFAALTEPDRGWPGDGILWADLRGGKARTLDRPPRGVNLGR